MLRFTEKKGRVSFGDRQVIDEKRLQTLVGAGERLRQLNRQVWDLLPRLEAAMSSAPHG
jgi:hypothetical protein